MNKPIKPQKPNKRENPPVNYELVEKVIMTSDNDIVLISYDEYKKVNPGEDWPAWENQGLNLFSERLRYSHIKRIKELLDENVGDFYIDPEYYDGYLQEISVGYNQLKPPGQYQKELDKFNNRFTIYEQKMQDYLAELSDYEEFKKTQKIARLQKS